jgi:hypothetical protein
MDRAKVRKQNGYLIKPLTAIFKAFPAGNRGSTPLAIFMIVSSSGLGRCKKWGFEKKSHSNSKVQHLI